jgi:hypothetical protein
VLPENAKAVEIGIGKMFVAVAGKLLDIRAERNSNNVPSNDRLPEVLPHDLAFLTPHHLNHVLLEQIQRLKNTGKTPLGRCGTRFPKSRFLPFEPRRGDGTALMGYVGRRPQQQSCRNRLRRSRPSSTSGPSSSAAPAPTSADDTLCTPPLPLPPPSSLRQ